jgi:hypothetical protein
MAYCTACGGVRGPLTTHSVTVAGQPTRVGGTVAKVFGWSALAMGWLCALGIFMVFGALFGMAPITWVLSVPFAVVATSIWLLSMLGSKSLTERGKALQRSTEEQAVFALAERRRGRLRSIDVSASFNRPLLESEHLLTEMAKRFPEHMAIDIDEDGALVFRFPSIDLEHRTRVVDAAFVQGPRVGGTAVQAQRPNPSARSQAFDGEADHATDGSEVRRGSIR